nr:Dihydrofolate reductase [uncultured bacterium]
MIVSILVAMDEKRAIGTKGGLPWRLSSDLKRFRELTMGHHIIVGRKTFESIGRPLPGRETIIITHKENYNPEGCFIVHSLEEAIELARSRGETEAFICGGAEIYAQSIDLADRFYLTLVHTVTDADTFFPEWNQGEWIEKESSDHPSDEKNQYSTTFKVLHKR